MPLPLGPSRAKSEPDGTSSETSSSATKSPKRFDTFEIEMLTLTSSRGLIRVMVTSTATAISASTSEMA